MEHRTILRLSRERKMPTRDDQSTISVSQSLKSRLDKLRNLPEGRVSYEDYIEYLIKKAGVEK